MWSHKPGSSYPWRDDSLLTFIIYQTVRAPDSPTKKMNTQPKKQWIPSEKMFSKKPVWLGNTAIYIGSLCSITVKLWLLKPGIKNAILHTRWEKQWVFVQLPALWTRYKGYVSYFVIVFNAEWGLVFANPIGNSTLSVGQNENSIQKTSCMNTKPAPRIKKKKSPFYKNT